MQGIVYVQVPSPGTRIMAGKVSGSRTVEDIVPSEELFPLHSIAENRTAQSPGGFMGSL